MPNRSTLTKIAMAAVIVLKSEIGHADESKSTWVLRGGGTWAATNPTNVNTSIDAVNNYVRSQNINTTLTPLGSILGPSSSLGYSFDNLELGFSFLSLNLETNAAAFSGFSGLGMKVGTGVNAFQLKSRLFVVNGDVFKLYLSPSVGVGSFYYNSVITSGSTATLASDNISAVYGGSIGTDITLNKTVAINLDIGYQSLQSGTLKASSVSGTFFPINPGQAVTPGAQDGINLSSVQITAGLVLRFGNSPREMQETSKREPSYQMSVEPKQVMPPAGETNSDTGPNHPGDIEDKLRRLQEMQRQGIITDQEYQNKKNQLLENF